ncbi:MAG: GNAT family N-acetyltransferase [Rhodospirillaceae bacterium]|nr:GNAT family N-acetyltransferase [Rhodospirillaceae bacterium]MCA8934183.1 GNAT family N-acetyltransferase [Rhodospirillaceae bacterium]
MSDHTAETDRPASVRSGDLEVRLAHSDAEIEAAQRLRFHIFYREMAAKPTAEMAASGRDFDAFDPFADHLLVLDHARGEGADAVVATYRLLRRVNAERAGHFYTADEYEIGQLLAQPGEILELGRSCVSADYRTGAVMQLLWRGIATYVFHYDIGIMFGCASLPGVDPEELAMPLSYLYHNHLAPPELRTRAVDSRYTPMDQVPADQLDRKAALRGLPPLIKGYLRLGGYVGDGAVVDPQFHTTDVCIIVKTDLVTQRYYKHYERQDAERQDPPPLPPFGGG